MKRIAFVLATYVLVASSCSDTIDNTGTCYDGIQNQGEQGVDCGGPCQSVCPSCADGILNQGETAVDCGGPCDPCYPRLAAIMNDTTWNSTSRNAFISAPGTLRIYGTNQMSNLTLYYSGPFAPGTSTVSQFIGEFRDESGNLFASGSSGSITFTTFDTTNRTVSGIFSFLGTNTTNGSTIEVENGIFNVLEY